MGKRSDFKRVERDYYRTFDPKAAQALEPHVRHGDMYVEPCAGDGSLIDNLDAIGLSCLWAGDIEPRRDGIARSDAMEHIGGGSHHEWIITNPPWSRPILHCMIVRFQAVRPTWLLFDAGWAFTRQAAPYLPHCAKIVTIGRMKWIEGTTMAGKDDCCWYLFDKLHSGGPSFYGMRP